MSANNLQDLLLEQTRSNKTNLCSFRFIVQEVVHFAGGAIVRTHDEAMIVHVENEILAHDGEADECYIRLWLRHDRAMLA